MSVGSEWLVDASGCDAEALTSLVVLRELFERVIRQLDLHPLHEPQFHVFPEPGGITGFVMLSESHLACHTYPEHGIDHAESLLLPPAAGVAVARAARGSPRRDVGDGPGVRTRDA